MGNEDTPRKVVIEIKGGLGNQMFQYAAGRSLALDLNATLLLETRLGFALDWQYRRTFQLNNLPVNFKKSWFNDSYPLYWNRVLSFMTKPFKGKHLELKSSKYIFEKDLSYIELESRIFPGNRLWMSGYFQDPRYFAKHKGKVLFELYPPVPKNKKYVELGKLSENFSLIALGIRAFEESSSPDVHARDGKQKTIADYNAVLSRLLKTVPDPLVLVFTTKEFEFLDSLNLPSNSIYVNADRGFTDSIDKLWLLTKCRHHIFNNSTFYWWGATLSENNYLGLDQQIYCSDNFLNQSITYPNWKNF
jgi:hypothetical protein